jgi:hypothetical protein
MYTSSLPLYCELVVDSEEGQEGDVDAGGQAAPCFVLLPGCPAPRSACKPLCPPTLGPAHAAAHAPLPPSCSRQHACPASAALSPCLIHTAGASPPGR